VIVLGWHLALSGTVSEFVVVLVGRKIGFFVVDEFSKFIKGFLKRASLGLLDLRLL
jgi:hypothetical protein